MEEEIRNLEIAKLSRASFLRDNFLLKGQFTFEKPPIVAGESLTSYTETGNLSTRNFENFGKVWNRRTSPSDFLLRKWTFVCNRGQYQAVCEYGGGIYISSNFGVDWKCLNVFGDWTSVGISLDGKTIAASEDTGQVLLSTDSGANFVELTDCPNTSTWTVLAVSEDGSKLVVGGIYGSNACNTWYYSHLSSPSASLIAVSPTYSLCFNSDASKVYLAEYKDNGVLYEFTLDPFSYTTIQPSNSKWVFIGITNGIIIALNENNTNNICINILNQDWSFLTIKDYPETACICNNSIFITTWEGACYTFDIYRSNISQVPEFPQVYSKNEQGITIEVPNDESYYYASAYENYLTIIQSYGSLYISQDNGENFQASSAFFDNSKFSLNTLGNDAFGSINGNFGNIMAGNVLFTTNDCGFTWNFAKSLTNTTRMNCSASSGKYQALGGYGYVLYSEDYGKNFELIRNDYFVYIDICITESKLLVLTISGDLFLYEDKKWKIIYTINSGISILTVTNSDFSKIYYIQYNGTNSNVYLSEDFGENFIFLNAVPGMIKSAQFYISSFVCSFDKTIRIYDDHMTSYNEQTFDDEIVKFVITDDGTYVAIFANYVKFSTDFDNWCYSTYNNNDFIINEGSFSDIFFTENTVFVTDNMGRIYRGTGDEFSDNVSSNHFTLQKSYTNHMSMSSSGQYIASVTYNSSIQISCNFGKTWFYANDILSANFTSCAVSMTGKYIVAVTAYNGYNDSYIYISKDYGQNFTIIQGISKNLILCSCAISGDGRIIAVLDQQGYYYYSENYGNSFLRTVLSGILRQVILSYNGKVSLVTTIDGKIYKNGKQLINNCTVTFASMSFNARFISLCCWINDLDPFNKATLLDVNMFKQYPFKILTSDDYGETFSKSQIYSEYQPYNIAMTANGQYQIASTYGGVYISIDYGGHFNLIKTTQILGNICSVCANSDGTILRMMDAASNIYECRPYEQRDQIMNYSVSPVISNDYLIDGTYDVYQITTDCTIISLPKISTLYPVTTRTITIVNITNSANEIKVVSEDDILYSGQKAKEIVMNIPYLNLQFMSNGSDSWFVLN